MLCVLSNLGTTKQAKINLASEPSKEEACAMSEGNGNVMVPPATFRCNKKKMILVVRIALHHVNPKQINLNTRKDHLELTTSGRRKYHLNKKYPREIEVDDSRTVARMEGNTLHIEMPVRSPPQRTREPPLPSTRLKEPDCRQGLSQHTHTRAHNSPSSILVLGAMPPWSFVSH